MNLDKIRQNLPYGWTEEVARRWNEANPEKPTYAKKVARIFEAGRAESPIFISILEYAKEVKENVEKAEALKKQLLDEEQK